MYIYSSFFLLQIRLLGSALHLLHLLGDNVSQKNSNFSTNTLNKNFFFVTILRVNNTKSFEWGFTIHTFFAHTHAHSRRNIFLTQLDDILISTKSTILARISRKYHNSTSNESRPIKVARNRRRCSPLDGWSTNEAIVVVLGAFHESWC